MTYSCTHINIGRQKVKIINITATANESISDHGTGHYMSISGLSKLNLEPPSSAPPLPPVNWFLYALDGTVL